MIRIKNQIKSLIDEKQGYLKHYQQSLDRLMAQEGAAQNPMIPKSEQRIENLTQEIEGLQNKLSKITSTSSTEYIEFVKEERQKSTEILARETEQKKIKNSKHTTDAVNKEKIYQSGRNQRKNDRWNKKKYDIYYKKYLQAVQTLPPYIRSNLEEMPNNKGYIWRGVQFFGKKLPEYGEQIILFEKKRGKLVIHKSSNHDWEIFEKSKDGKNKPIDSGKRTVKFTPPSDWPKIKYAKKKQSNTRKRNNNNYKQRNLQSWGSDRQDTHHKEKYNNTSSTQSNNRSSTQSNNRSSTQSNNRSSTHRKKSQYKKRK